MGILLNNLCSYTITFYTHIFDTTSALFGLHIQLDGFLPLFLKDYKPNQNLKFSSNFFKFAFQHMPQLSVSNPFRMIFENKRFCECILTIVSTLFPYYTRSHPMSDCAYPWSGSILRHDQAFRWSSSHYCGGNIILTHKPRFMP
jgi:hypothetical protein